MTGEEPLPPYLSRDVHVAEHGQRFANHRSGHPPLRPLRLHHPTMLSRPHGGVSLRASTKDAKSVCEAGWGKRVSPKKVRGRECPYSKHEH
jgi:hypothetical protein